MKRSLVVGFLFVASACQVPKFWTPEFWEIDPTYREVAVTGKSLPEVFAVAEGVLAEEATIERSEPQAGILETRWEVRPHPFPGKGVRERIEVSLRTPEGGEGVIVRVAHRLEENRNKKDVMNLDKAEWRAVRADGTLAEVLCRRIAYRLGSPPAPAEGAEERAPS